MPFKIREMIFFSEKKIVEKNMCAYPIKNFRPDTRNTLIFYLALTGFYGFSWSCEFEPLSCYISFLIEILNSYVSHYRVERQTSYFVLSDCSPSYIAVLSGCQHDSMKTSGCQRNLMKTAGLISTKLYGSDQLQFTYV